MMMETSGTSPDGKLFKVSPEGKIELLWDSGDSYIWDIKIDDGEIWIATGNQGNIYRYKAGSAKLFYHSCERHIRTIALTTGGDIIAGTANNGVIYKINREGKATPLLTSKFLSVDSICISSSGDVYAASGDSVYLLKTDGKIKTYVFPEKPIMRLIADKGDSIYAAAGNNGKIYRISPDDTLTALFHLRESQILSLSSGENGEIYASTGTDAKIFEISSSLSESGTFTSDILDALMPSRWGKIRWSSILPQGTSITIQSRSGETQKPDSSWSCWSGEYSISAGSRVISPPARFFQLKINLKGKENKSPILNDLTLFYRDRIMPPSILITSPEGGERWSGKKKIKWLVDTPNQEEIAYDIFYSDDEGKTWKEIKRNILPDIKDSPAPPKTSTPEEYEWNTNKLKDGTYIIKIKAYNNLDPADSSLQKEYITKPFIICNTPPEISILSRKSGDDFIEIRGLAKSKMVNITDVSYKIGDKKWYPAIPSDGIYDSPRKEFIIRINYPKPGLQEINIKGTDEAENTTEFTIKNKIGTIK